MVTQSYTKLSAVLTTAGGGAIKITGVPFRLTPVTLQLRMSLSDLVCRFLGGHPLQGRTSFKFVRLLRYSTAACDCTMLYYISDAQPFLQPQRVPHIEHCFSYNNVVM
jgi:hypothetical protein